jgi:hypothetical protein
MGDKMQYSARPHGQCWPSKAYAEHRCAGEGRGNAAMHYASAREMSFVLPYVLVSGGCPSIRNVP